MSDIFNRLERQAFRAGITPRTKESREWFFKKAKNMRSINREALMKEEPLRSRSKQIIGGMYMFQYVTVQPLVVTKRLLPFFLHFHRTYNLHLDIYSVH